jgi:hypothetical protein
MSNEQVTMLHFFDDLRRNGAASSHVTKKFRNVFDGFGRPVGEEKDRRCLGFVGGGHAFSSGF